jgi:hypothetical protein
MQRPWPLAKGGFVLVVESLTAIISVRLLRSYMVRGYNSNEGHWHDASTEVLVYVHDVQYSVQH